MGPRSGSATSTTLPSASRSSSENASSGVRTTWTPSLTRSPQTAPLLRRELLERGLHEREVIEEDDDVLWLHADSCRVDAPMRVLGGRRVLQPVGLRRIDDRLWLDGPLVHPPAVLALEQAPRRPAQVHPRGRHRSAAAGARRDEGRPRQHGGFDVLSHSGSLPGDQRRGDRQGPVIEAVDAHPRRGAEDGAVRPGCLFRARRYLDVREAEVARRHDAATLSPVRPRPGGGQRLETRTSAVFVVFAVGGDGARDEARIPRGQRRMPKPEPLHDTRSVGIEDDVGPCREVEKGPAAVRRLEVEDRAALATVPHPVAGGLGEDVFGRLDSRDEGPLVGQHHPDHRPGDPPGELQHPDPGQGTRHQRPVILSIG